MLIEFAFTKYGSTEKAAMQTAYVDSLKCVKVAMKRYNALINANVGVRALHARLPKKTTAAAYRKELMHQNAVDGFGTLSLTVGGGFLETFELKLKKRQF